MFKEKLIVFFLTAVALLPLKVLYIFSDFMAFIIHRVIKYRREIIMTNLSQSFPDKSQEEIKLILKKFYRHLTDVMVETVKLFHISDRQMARRAEILNYEEVNRSIDEGKSTVIFLGHYGNWEWVQEISRYLSDKAYKGDIYRALYNKTWDHVFLKLRSRWGIQQIEHDEAFRKILRLTLNGEVWSIGFIADQRPFVGHFSNWTRFLNHRTAFTVGAEEIGRRTKADYFYLDIRLKKRGYYSMTFKKLRPIDDEEPYPFTRSFYRSLQESIERDPSLWLWSHNRWAWQPQEPEQ